MLAKEASKKLISESIYNLYPTSFTKSHFHNETLLKREDMVKKNKRTNNKTVFAISYG
jgi:hypothetical protein